MSLKCLPRAQNSNQRLMPRDCVAGPVAPILSSSRSARSTPSLFAGCTQRGVLVRDRSSDPGCDGRVRITIGTRQQMQRCNLPCSTRRLAAMRNAREDVDDCRKERPPTCDQAQRSVPRAFARNTTETRIAIKLTIEGTGQYKVSTGIRFFDHMLELFTRHGAFDLELKCDGDLDVDQHHTVEDVGIALGEAFDRALGDKRGILRAGYFLMPMDETLAIAAIDLSGRAAFAVDTKVRTRLVGDLQTELVADFFEGFARGARANVHVKTMYGRSNHHKIEAIFKAFARALRAACSRDKQLGENASFHKGPALMRVTVIDYKAGNLTSVLKALRHLGADPVVTDRDLSHRGIRRTACASRRRTLRRDAASRFHWA